MNQTRRNFVKASGAAAVAPAIISSAVFGQGAGDPISFGDKITLSNTTDISKRGSTGLLGIYDKGPKYLVCGAGNDPALKLPKNTTWQIQKTGTDPGKGPLNYGDPFALLNVDTKLWASDNKTSDCFDGADGYFGLAPASNGKVTCANQFQLLGKKGAVNNKDSGLILQCATQSWKCVGQTLTLYAFNEAVYLVWDSPNEPVPKFTIAKA